MGKHPKHYPSGSKGAEYRTPQHNDQIRCQRDGGRRRARVEHESVDRRQTTKYTGPNIDQQPCSDPAEHVSGEPDSNGPGASD